MKNKELIDIEKIVILKRRTGTDMIYIHTTLPSPFTYYEEQKQKLVLQCETTKGHAEEYVREHFINVENIEIIDTERVTV